MSDGWTDGMIHVILDGVIKQWCYYLKRRHNGANFRQESVVNTPLCDTCFFRQKWSRIGKIDRDVYVVWYNNLQAPTYPFISRVKIFVF